MVLPLPAHSCDDSPVAKTKRKPKKPYNVAFGKRLEIGRKGVKGGSYTQEQFAADLGVGLAAYHKYARGERSFPIDKLSEVVRLTGLGPWFLISGEQDLPYPARLTDSGVHRKLKTM